MINDVNEHIQQKSVYNQKHNTTTSTLQDISKFRWMMTLIVPRVSFLLLQKGTFILFINVPCLVEVLPLENLFINVSCLRGSGSVEKLVDSF